MVRIRPRREDRRMLVHAQSPQRPPRRPQTPHLPTHPDVPQLHLPVPARADQLPHPAPLHVQARDPLLVAAVAANHGVDGLLALVVDLDLAVAEAGNEDVAGDLVGG